MVLAKFALALNIFGVVSLLFFPLWIYFKYLKMHSDFMTAIKELLS